MGDSENFICPKLPETRLEKLREEQDKVYGNIFYLKTSFVDGIDKATKDIIINRIKLKYHEILVIQTEIENEIKAIKGDKNARN